MRRGFLLVPSAERKTTRPAADRTAVVASIDKKSKVTQDASSRCKPVTKDQLSKSKPISINYDTTIVIQDNPLILLSNNIPGSPYFGYFPPGSAEPELVLVHNGLETVKRAANWPVWKTTSQSAYVLDQKSDTFKIVPVEGKGFGMVAARTIRAGELICQERYCRITCLDG